MNDELRDRYEEVPYRQGAFPLTHPARTGAIARLFGVAAVSPEHCRFLELGCGEGNNLLPLADRLPEAHFTGVDFSATEIATAEASRAAGGLKNVELIRANFLDYEPEPESFDYIVVHGVYSWVPDDVKERILLLCERALAPNGVAYVSYNTYPGWNLRKDIRNLILPALEGETTPAARMARAEAMLRAISAATEGRKDSYAEVLRDEIATQLKKARIVFYHDELASVNDPCFVTEFVARAEAHGLQYVGDARFATMAPENASQAARAAINTLGFDTLRVEQMFDILRNRAFRATLMSRSGIPLRRPADASVMRDCAVQFRTRLIAAAGIDLKQGVSVIFNAGDTFTASSDKTLVKAAIGVLSRHWPHRITWTDLLAKAAADVTAVGLPIPTAEDETSVCTTLLVGFAKGVLDALLIGDPAATWLRLSRDPRSTPLVRHQAATGLPIANQWHDIMGITDEDRAWLGKWEGGSSVEDLARSQRLAKLGIVW